MALRLVVVHDIEPDLLPNLVQVMYETKICSCLRASQMTTFSGAGGTLEPRQLFQLEFKVLPKNLNCVVKTLQANDFCSFDVLDVVVTTDHVPRERRPRVAGWFRANSSRDRLSTLEIHNAIISASHLTFDHLVLVVIASLVAAVGLLGNSPVNILASFFVSPLMSMVMTCTWGFVIGDVVLARRGLRNMIYGASLAVGIGFLLGSLLGLCGSQEDMQASIGRGHGIWVLFSVNSQEIISRGPPVLPCLSTNAIIAASSGVLVALGQSNGISGALAGVTLAASLLPPLVNCGLTLGFGVTHPGLTTTPQRTRMFAIAPVSLSMYMETVFIMIPCAFLTFKAKRIGGLFMQLHAGPRSPGSALEPEPEVDLQVGAFGPETSPVDSPILDPPGFGNEDHRPSRPFLIEALRSRQEAAPADGGSAAAGAGSLRGEPPEQELSEWRQSRARGQCP